MYFLVGRDFEPPFVTPSVHTGIYRLLYPLQSPPTGKPSGRGMLLILQRSTEAPHELLFELLSIWKERIYTQPNAILILN